MHGVGYININKHTDHNSPLPQNVMMDINDKWKELTIAEQSVLVNIFHSPEAVFIPGTKAYKTCRPRFISSLILHMESDVFIMDEDLCVCVLMNIRGMLEKPPELMEAVSHVTVL